MTRKAATQLEEAALWAEDVRHDRILPVAAVAQGKGELGVVSEVFAGEPLSSLLELAQAEGSPVPNPVALAIAVDMLEALTFIHETDDKQPTRFGGVCAESVLVGSDGHARLREIGMSAVAAATIPWANDPRRAAYRAPEALKLAAKQTPCSDVFSVGVVLWEMLAGEYLFEGKTRMAVQQTIRSGTIVRIDAKSGGTVDEAVADIIAKALQRDPDDRLATPAEMMEAIQATGQTAGAEQAVAEWVEKLAGETMAQRDDKLATAAEGGGEDEAEGEDRPSQDRASQPRRPPPPKRKGGDDGPAAPKPGGRPSPPRKSPEEEALMTGDFEVVALESEPPEAPDTPEEELDVSFSEPPPADEPSSPKPESSSEGDEPEDEEPKDEEPKDEEPEDEEPEDEEPKDEEPKDSDAGAAGPPPPVPPRPSGDGDEPSSPDAAAADEAPADDAADEDEEPEDDEPKDEGPEDEGPEDEEPKDQEPKDQEPKDQEPKDEEPKDDDEDIPSPFADEKKPADEPKDDKDRPAKPAAAAKAADKDDDEDDKPVAKAAPIALDALDGDDLLGTEPQPKSKTPLIIGVTVVALILIAVWAFSGGEETTSSTTAAPSAPTRAGTPPTATTSAAPETTSSAAEPGDDEDAGAEEEDAGAPVATTKPPVRPPSQPGKWPPKRPPKKPPTTFTPSDI
ncbi:MAG: protein kinase [Deltaproteobacteria bacterium]|nr:protein kinase [Deltaproteobacteria bacterium]